MHDLMVKKKKLADMFQDLRKNKRVREINQHIFFPVDLVYQDGSFEGFIMYEAPKHRTFFDYCKSDYDYNLQIFNVRDSIDLAINLCDRVNEIHSAGYVIGDFNSSNILVGETGEVYIIDVDSFCFKNYMTGKARPEFQAIETMFAINENNTLAEFSKNTDYYALAAHLYQLIVCNAYMNKSGEFEGLEAYACPLSDKKYEMPKFSILKNEVPKSLRKLFVKSFSTNKKRPTALQYKKALLKLKKQGFKECVDHPHVYFKKLKKCPYCSLAKRNKFDKRIKEKESGIDVRPDQTKMPFKKKARIAYQVIRGLLLTAPVIAFTIMGFIKSFDFKLIWPFKLFEAAYIPMSIICLVLLLAILVLVVVFRKKKFKSLLFSILFCALGILLLYLGHGGLF